MAKDRAAFRIERLKDDTAILYRRVGFFKWEMYSYYDSAKDAVKAMDGLIDEKTAVAAFEYRADGSVYGGKR